MNNIDFEYEKSLILQQESIEKDKIAEKYSNLCLSTSIVKYNARAIPLTLLNDKNCSCLLYCYLQKHSNWDKDKMQPYRYIWKEYTLTRTIEQELKGDLSRISSHRVVCSKMKKLIQEGYLEDCGAYTKIYDMWLLGEATAYALVSMKILDKILKHNDEFMARMMIWYCYMQYRNGLNNFFICRDKTLCKNTSYSYSSNTKLRIKSIRDILLKENVIETLTHRGRNHETGKIEDTISIRVAL